MRRLLKPGLYGLLVASLALLLGLLWVLGSSNGSRWALDRIPGLQVEGFSGQLGGQWRAGHLRWVQGDQGIDVESALLDWSPACLLRLTLCIERLQAERVSLSLPPGKQGGDQPPRLPELSLPLALRLDEVRIGRLLINGDEQLQDLQLAAQWRVEGLRVENLRLRRGELSINLRGTLRPGGQWPLSAEGELQLPAPDQQPWRLAVRVEGDLLRSLNLTADSSGYLNGRLTGEVQPLAAHLPARAQLTADGFTASGELPQTLRLDRLVLDAHGDLEQGYALDGHAELPAEGGALGLQLQGLVHGEGAEIAALSLTADARRYLRLSGQLDWRDTFSLDSRLHWQDFPWQRLFPAVQEMPVALRQLSAELAYQGGNYLGNFAAELEGPAGRFSLASPLSGDLQQLFLPEVKLRAGQGRADGQLSLRFATGLRWDARLQLSDLDPGYWLAQLPGRLGGPLRSQGEVGNTQLNLDLDVDLAGRLRGQAAQLRAQASAVGPHWSLRRLDLRLGDNRIDGSGQWQQQLDGQLRIELARLDQLWPDLRGRLAGRLDLAGTPQAPQGHLQLRGRQLALADQRLQRLQLDARLDREQRGHLQLQAEGLASGATELGRLNVSGQGDQQRQQLQVELDGALLYSALALQGRLGQGTWRGQLSSGEVRLAGQEWRLQAPAALVRLADGQVSLAAHCWRAGAASLCGETQRLLPSPSLRMQLADFPLDSLAQWLPNDVAWQGQLDADISLDLPASGPNGRIVVDVGSGTWRIREQEQWLDFAYDSLRLSSQLRAERIDAQLELSGPQIGQLSLQAQLDPRTASKPLSGLFRLDGLDLALARPFLPMVEQLSGRLDGDGQLGGNLLAPQINGRLRLSHGQLAGGQLPSRFDDLQVQALIAGERLQLSGDWRSGEQGRGSLAGELDWSRGLAGELRLRGSRLPVSVEPYAELEVEPDLRLGLMAEQLSLAGRVRIPRGKIVIRELPPTTVPLSDDAVIVGDESAASKPLAIAMDVDVEVGQERLSFSGFGLKADLAGAVHIGDDLDTRGELTLNNGRFRAYGQRLTIRRARLLFAGPIDQPFIDVEAIRRVDQVVAGLRLSGSAEQPKSEVFAEPAMSQEQALAYLVLGRPLGQGSGDSDMFAQAALAVGLAGSAPLTGSLAQGLGIEDFQVDTEGSGLTTSVVASGKLSERLSLRYGVGVFEPANTVALRYELAKSLYLEAASGLASSLDLFYHRDF